MEAHTYKTDLSNITLEAGESITCDHKVIRSIGPIRVIGDHNEIHTDNSEIEGSYNQIYGSENLIKGNHNIGHWSNNRFEGFHNVDNTSNPRPYTKPRIINELPQHQQQQKITYLQEQFAQHRELRMKQQLNEKRKEEEELQRRLEQEHQQAQILYLQQVQKIQEERRKQQEKEQQMIRLQQQQLSALYRMEQQQPQQQLQQPRLMGTYSPQMNIVQIDPPQQTQLQQLQRLQQLQNQQLHSLQQPRLMGTYSQQMNIVQINPPQQSPVLHNNQYNYNNIQPRPVAKRVLLVIEDDKEESLFPTVAERVHDEVALENDHADHVCVICFDHKRQCLIRPCKHFALCITCSSDKLGFCPLCRCKISSIERLFK